MKNTTSHMLTPETRRTVAAIANSINAGQSIIFCGAGISRDSGFPVVNELVPYILLTLCPSSQEVTDVGAILKTITDAKQRQIRLKQIIAEKMGVSPEVIDKIINGLPFEAFMDILHDSSSIEEILEIYDSGAYYPHVEPNTNHFMLANLVATGKVRTIVTTNFDQLIEKALEKVGKIAERDYDVFFRDEDFSRINWALDRCHLIKLHGSIEDKQAMSVTLRQIARQALSEPRTNIIRQVFSLGGHKHVLVLGYSCSDHFDISPQIEALAENLKQVSLVQHSDSPTVENIRNQEQKNPFKSFSNSTRLFLNTGDFVEALWKATLEEPYKEHEVLNPNPDWRTKVQSWYKNSVANSSEAIKDLICGRLLKDICEWREAIGRYERVLTFAKEHADTEHEMFALGNIGNIYRNLAEYDKAVAFHEALLEIARRTGNIDAESGVLGSIGSDYMQRGEYYKAIEFYEQALGIARRVGDMQGEGTNLGNMGNAYLYVGEYRKAIRSFEQYLKIARHIGDMRGLGIALCNMGNAYNYLGEFRKAIKICEQSLDLTRRIGNVSGECGAIGNIANAYSNLGEYRKAIKLYEQSLEIARHIGDIHTEGGILGNIGSAYSNLGEYREAIRFYEQRIEIARRIGDVQGEGNDLGNMGNAYSNLGEHRKAIKFYEQSLEVAQRIGDKRNEGFVLGNMGSTYALIGERVKAAQAFAQSKTTFVKLGLPHMADAIDNTMRWLGL